MKPSAASKGLGRSTRGVFQQADLLSAIGTVCQNLGDRTAWTSHEEAGPMIDPQRNETSLPAQIRLRLLWPVLVVLRPTQAAMTHASTTRAISTACSTPTMPPTVMSLAGR